LVLVLVFIVLVFSNGVWVRAEIIQRRERRASASCQAVSSAARSQRNNERLLLLTRRRNDGATRVRRGLTPAATRFGPTARRGSALDAPAATP
jgi:hypothetical protein